MTTRTQTTIEHAHGLFLALADDAYRSALSVEEHLLIDEAFDEFANPAQAGVLFDDHLSPAAICLTTILNALRADLAQLIADSTRLEEALRYTRARDLLEHVIGRG